MDKPKITANPSDLEFVYNGSVRLVELKDILSGSYPTDVNIKYSNTDGSVATPLNAGTYLVTVTRTGDENWRSFEATKKLVIKKAKVVEVVAPTASTITEGQSCRNSYYPVVLRKVPMELPYPVNLNGLMRQLY